MARASAAGEQDALRGYGYQYDHIAAAVYDHYPLCRRSGSPADPPGPGSARRAGAKTRKPQGRPLPAVTAA